MDSFMNDWRGERCERQEAGLSCRIVRSRVHEHADASHALGLLRLCRKRPRGHASEQSDEFSPPQMTEMHLPPRFENRIPSYSIMPIQESERRSFVPS